MCLCSPRFLPSTKKANRWIGYFKLPSGVNVWVVLCPVIKMNTCIKIASRYKHKPTFTHTPDTVQAPKQTRTDLTICFLSHTHAQESRCILVFNALGSLRVSTQTTDVTALPPGVKQSSLLRSHRPGSNEKQSLPYMALRSPVSPLLNIHNP